MSRLNMDVETSGVADLCVVTGAFAYSGKYITRRLLTAGKRVRTLTNWLTRDSLGHRYSSELARRRDRRRSYEDLRMRA